MANERETEEIVRSNFKEDPLFNVIKLEEQRSNIPGIKECLSKASKNKTGKPGYPEFIISIPSLPNNLIIVECKANPAFHGDPNGDFLNPKEYAIDGVIHYAKFLTPKYNVISIAVSGSEEVGVKVSSFYHEKGSEPLSVTQEDTEFLNIYSYMSKFNGETVARNIESEEITKIAIDLNKELNDYSIPEYERCTLLGAILLALQNDGFASSYEKDAKLVKKDEVTQQILAIEPKPERIAEQIVIAIEKVLQDNNIDSDRTKIIKREYERIKSMQISIEPKIKKKRKGSKEEGNYVLRNIVSKLDQTIIPLMKMGDKGYDVLGKFYTEFIRYAGTDKKTGLVLTPPLM